MFDRRTLVVGGVTTMLVPLSAAGQPSGKVWRVVFFSVAAGPNPVPDAFRRGLSELGYVDGSNLAVEYRWMAGHEDQYDEVARQVAESQPDVIVAAGYLLAVAAKKATAQIPIVVLGGNPVAADLAASIAHPAGNLTGFSLDVTPETNAKMLELLHEAAPKIIRIGALWNSAVPDSRIYLDAAEQAARSLNVALNRTSSSGASCCTCCPRVSTASATTASLPQPTAPRASQRPAHSSMSSRLPPIPNKSRILRRIRRVCCRVHVPAVARA